MVSKLDAVSEVRNRGGGLVRAELRTMFSSSFVLLGSSMGVWRLSEFDCRAMTLTGKSPAIMGYGRDGHGSADSEGDRGARAPESEGDRTRRICDQKIEANRGSYLCPRASVAALVAVSVL